MKFLFIPFCLLAFNISLAQSYFEGEITYQWSRERKDSSFDLSKIISYPATHTVLYVKKGKWLHQPNSGPVEYMYFDNVRNMTAWKIRGLDTLFCQPYESRTQDQDSILTITTQAKTDTVLDKACNSLILRTAKATLTFIYNSDIETNPDWFIKTKGGYYDIIYSRTRALYLGFILETDQYVAKSIATKIVHRSIPDTFFPDIDHMPKKEL